MDTSHFREIFETIIPQSKIARVASKVGLTSRERKKDVQKLVTAMIASSAAGDGGRQAAAIKRYIDDGAPRVGRSSACSWFDEKLSKTLKLLARDALTFVQNQPVDLPGWIGKHVTDWHIVDSTSAMIDKSMKEKYSGLGDYAALKVHKRLSIGVGAVVDYHFSSASEHDSQHLKIDESWRKKGLLADLGYASFKVIEACSVFDVRFVLRLKDNWKPKITAIHRGSVKKPLAKDADFDTVINKNIVLNGRAIDLAAILEKDGRKIAVRIVGVCTKTGSYQFYLTDLPRSVGPQQVSDLCRVRWEIENDNKVSKTCFSLDEIGAKTVGALHCMLHAAMLGNIIACLLTHAHNMKNKPDADGDHVPERDYAPLHPQLIAGYMSTGCHSIASAFLLDEKEANLEWQRIGELILHFGRDIHWRRRPSILDQLRGWPAPKFTRKTTRACSKKG